MNKKIVIGIIIAIILVVVAVGGGFVIYKNTNTENAKIGESQSSLFASKSHKPAHLRKQIGRLSYKHQH